MEATNPLNRSRKPIDSLWIALASIAALMVLVSYTPFDAASGYGDESVFAPAEEPFITDEEARLALARVLSYRSHTLLEARAEYERILAENPDRLDAGIELADVLIRLQDLDEARKHLETILLRHPNHVGALIKIAELEASLGHAKTSRSRFQQAIALEPANRTLQLAYAQAMQIWGDFYGIERIYRSLLQRTPEDVELWLKLAEVLVSAQRYEEAEGIYERLRWMGLDRRSFCLNMARLQYIRKDYGQALDALACVHASSSQHTAADGENRGEAAAHASEEWIGQTLALEADVLERLGRIEDSERCIDGMIRNPHTEMIGWKAAARYYRRRAAFDESMWEKASMAANQAIQLAIRDRPELSNSFNTQDVPPQRPIHHPNISFNPLILISTAGHSVPRVLIPMLYIRLGKEVLSDRFVDGLLNDPSLTPLDWCTWADQYTVNGRPDIAWRLHARAAQQDPDCFPARLGLAENLAYNQRYDDSLKVLEALAQEEPEHGKIWITYARVLSWDKQYEKAIDTYDHVHAILPEDPTPVRESARVAVWGKRMNEAMDRYGSLMDPAVDMLLHQALLQEPSTSARQLLRDLFGSNDSPRDSSGYSAYESFLKRLSLDPELSMEEALQRIRIALLPRYQIQKGVDLERTAKLEAWNKRFLAAKDAYERLIDFDPGNAEALFDDAQVKCSLGLSNEEDEPYRALLRMDPTHMQARRGLERNDIRSRVRIGMDGRGWMEKGRGDLSDYGVYSFRGLAEIPIRQDRYGVSAGMDLWYEFPKSENRTIEALGYTLQTRGVILPWLSGNFRWTHKVYQDTDLGTSDFFDVSVRFRMHDRLWLDLGWERTDDIANAFALKQQIRSDHWKLGLHSQISRRWDAGIKAEFMDYSDDNTGKMVSGSLGYAFSDHPRIFKVTITETWRDTEAFNRFLFEDGRIIDIVHPYWTPQSLTESVVTLEWNHDLAEELFCGAPEHVYDVRLSFGTDTEDNTMARLEADWKVEIADHWLLVLRGVIHESRQWDARGIWAEIRYRF